MGSTLSRIRATMNDAEGKVLDGKSLVEYHRILRRKAVGAFSEDDLVHVFARLLHTVLQPNGATGITKFAKSGTERRMVQLLSQPSGYHMRGERDYVSSIDQRHEALASTSSPSIHAKSGVVLNRKHATVRTPSSGTRNSPEMKADGGSKLKPISRSPSRSPLKKRAPGFPGGGIEQPNVGGIIEQDPDVKRAVDFAFLRQNQDVGTFQHPNLSPSRQALHEVLREKGFLRSEVDRKPEVDFHGTVTPYVVTFHDLRKCVPRELLEILLRKYDPYHFGGITCAEFITMAQLAMHEKDP
eukprot:g635.t1